MPPLRCALCERLLMVDRDRAVASTAPPICEPCRALPAAAQIQRRNQVMTRMLWDELRAADRRQA